MNLINLQELVKYGESETIEFKNTTGQRSEALKTVVQALLKNGVLALLKLLIGVVILLRLH